MNWESNYLRIASHFKGPRPNSQRPETRSQPLQPQQFMLPPPTLMLPLPFFIPLPVPIPLLVPVPDTKYQNAAKSNPIKSELSPRPASTPVQDGLETMSDCSSNNEDLVVDEQRRRRRALIIDKPSRTER